MPDKPTPPTPTTLAEWSKSESYQQELSSALRQPFMVGALAVLREMNAPKALTSSDLGAGAMCHQYHAGWEACLRALRGLPATNEAAFSKIKKSAILEQAGPWSQASNDPALYL